MKLKLVFLYDDLTLMSFIFFFDSKGGSIESERNVIKEALGDGR